jgi:hypothetical protein
MAGVSLCVGDMVAPIHVTVGTEFSSCFAPDPVRSGPFAKAALLHMPGASPVKVAAAAAGIALAHSRTNRYPDVVEPP